MTTSSKTNMNEELKKEFDNKHGSNIDEAFVRLGMKPYAYGVWEWIETAITKAREGLSEEIESIETDIDDTHYVQGFEDALNRVIELLSQDK